MKEIDQIKRLCKVYGFEFVSFKHNGSDSEVEVVINPISSILTFKRRVKLNVARVAIVGCEGLARKEFLKLSRFYENILPILKDFEVSK